MNSPAQAIRLQSNPALDGCWVSSNATQAVETPAKVDASLAFYISLCLEAAAQRDFQGVDLTIWCTDDPHSADLSVKAIDANYDPSPSAIPLPLSAPPSPRTPVTPVRQTLGCPRQRNFPVHLQLNTSDGSEMVSYSPIEPLKNGLPPQTRILFHSKYEVDDHGRILCGYFLSSKPLYKVFIDPSGDANEGHINHISARLLVPDPNRSEMPLLCPEIVEQIFSSCCVRSCDWPGCRIHAKQNLFVLAQVCSEWLYVARRMHRTKEATSKKLVEQCTTFEYSYNVAMPSQVEAIDPRCYFSISTIFEGLSAKPFAGIQLSISIYGSDTPAPDITVQWLGQDGKEIQPEQEKGGYEDPTEIYYPLHLRLDTWNSLDGITAYSLGSSEPSWSSRELYQRKHAFKNLSSPNLGWFKITKPIWLDRKIQQPTHFCCRVSTPSPKRKPFKQLPPALLERIFLAAQGNAEEETFAPNAMFGFPGVQTLPDYAWSNDLRRYAGVCKAWANVAKKLHRFEVLIGQLTGFTHASCFSFAGLVKEPNYLFAVSVIFDGSAVRQFQGASLEICVPEEGLWSDVNVAYVGESLDNVGVHSQISSIPSSSAEYPNDQICRSDTPILPLSLCLSTSQDDSDSYHVSIRDFPGTRSLCKRRIQLQDGSNSAFFGYFTSSRAFNGSAVSAIPFHVIRVALPEPKRKRFPKLPVAVIKRIAEAVTELSDSLSRTEAWADNLRSMSGVNRQFRSAAAEVAWNMANPSGAALISVPPSPLT